MVNCKIRAKMTFLIYNEKLYSYFTEAELVEKQDNITGTLNINNNKGYYNNYWITSGNGLFKYKIVSS